MLITHYGHACVLLEDPSAGARRLLIDPGSPVADLSGVNDIDSILVTHGHPDHLDDTKLAEIRSLSPDSALFVDQETYDSLSSEEKPRARVVDAQDDAEPSIAGFSTKAFVANHEEIVPGLPMPPNTAYLFNGRVLHPGDSFFCPDVDVDVLLLPIGGPWLKLSEAVDYVNRVAPRVAIPIHQGGLSEEHRSLHCQVIEGFAPRTELLVLQEGVATEV